MELEGKIFKVLPLQSGTSQATGNAWMSQEYILEYFWFPNQTQPSYICLRVFGEDRIKRFNLQPNDEVKIRFHADAREYEGRWYNELRIDSVKFVGASAGKNAAAEAARQKPQGGQQQGTDQQQAAEQPQQQEGGENEHLPF